MKKALFGLVMLALLVSPLAAFGATGVTYTSGFQLQNLSGTGANLVIDFFNQDGTQPTGSSISDTIAGSTMKVYYPLSTVPSGFNGSAVVSSDQPLAAIANVLGNSGQRGDSYGGFSAGATTVNLPLIMKGNYNNDTWFNVQNTGSADANVTVTYKPGSCTENATIKPSASHTFDQYGNACLGTKFVGTGVVTSNQPVAAVVMEVGPQNLLTYTGFADTALKPVFPLVMTNNYSNFTSVNVMNAGASDTNVTLSYTPSAGAAGTACTETRAITAGQMQTFGYPTMPAGCGTKFVGSGAVTTNSASMPLVAVVNQVSSASANSSAYNGFNPANATAHVSLPLVMDRNYGLYTGISIVNMGTTNTNISCTFTGGTAYTLSGTAIPPGGSVTDVQNNKIGDRYVGAGTCTASGGADNKIAGIVNQIKSADAASDVLFTYSGINY